MSALSPLVVVEDSDEDFAALTRVLREAGLAGVLRYPTGEQALAGVSPAAPPALVLLDLNLPGLRGLELLALWKSDAALRVVPVVVLSGSARQEDVRAAYSAGANAYLTKSLDLARLRRTVRALDEFWQVALLPERAE